MIAHCHYQDGSVVPFCTLSLCRALLGRLEAQGYRFLAGLELEFYIFKLTDRCLEAEQSGQPSEPPRVRMLAHGYQWPTENRFDELEPILDQLRAALMDLDLPVCTLEVEMGSSQCEITFGPVAGLRAADNVMLARSAIKQICRRNGYHATFMCRPALPNMASSGWHPHQSLLNAKTGRNVFVSDDPRELLSPCAQQFMAGLLENAPAACLLTTPTIDGYKRYRPYSLAPNKIVWARDNRGAMIRVIGSPGDRSTHIENRIGESAANPYLYFASQVVSGMDGMARALKLPPAVDDPYDADAGVLPSSIVDAFVDYWLTMKDFEVRRFLSEEVTD